MKYFLTVSIVILSLVLVNKNYAQTLKVKAGLNLSKMYFKDNDRAYNSDIKLNPGFLIGPSTEFKINNSFTFETGLLLSTKGYKYNNNFDSDGISVTEKDITNLYYIDIPINFNAKFPIGNVKVYGLLGPYIGIGVIGKSKKEISYLKESTITKTKLKWGSGITNSYKRLDYGITIGTGVEIKALQIGISYALGLANIASTTNNGYKANNRVISLSLGYKFMKD